MARGLHFEDEARNVFAINRAGNWNPLNIEQWEGSIFRASLDGYNSYTNCILEIKIPNRKVLDMARFGQLPINYLYQVQWQLFASGCPKAFYFCYNPDTLESYTVEVYPDEAIWDVMIPKAVDFWQNVQNSLPPPAKRSLKQAPANAAAVLKEMLECKEKEKEASERYKSLLAELMEIEGVEDGLESDNATLSVSERSSYDYKKAAEDAGVNLEAYKKPITKVWVVRAKT